MIDEDPAHQAGGEAEEVRTVLPPHAMLVDELQVRLVHEGRRGQRVVSALAVEVPSGDAPQLGVHRLQQAVARLLLPVTPGQEQRRDVDVVGHVGGVRAAC
jgi:hypothetical protein